MPAKTYVRLTFRPHGARRDRTVWAELGYQSHRDRASYWRVTREGERPEPAELIIVGTGESTTQPAVMSLKYGMLMLASDPDLQNEVDNALRG